MAMDERTSLEKTDRQFSAAAREGNDLDLVVSFWADDAKVFAPGAPVLEGKAAIRDFVLGSFKTPGFAISWEPTDVETSTDGTMGYTAGRNRMTMPDGTGNLVTSTGRYVTVWRKERDGQWKCIVDTWNVERVE